VVVAALLGVALIVAVVLLAAGGGTDEKVDNAQRAETAANKRADRAQADLADQKARVKQLDGDLRRAQVAAARAGRRATAATRRSRQLRRALTRERRR
jgi:hypothetical protein